MLPIEEAGDTGLQRRERQKKQVSRERDGHAADRRSGRHWSPETGETEETGLKGKRRTCCRSKKRATLVSRDGRDGRNRSQGKETDMLPIEGVSDNLSLETETKWPSIQGSNRPSFNEQRLTGGKRNCQTAWSQGIQAGR